MDMFSSGFSVLGQYVAQAPIYFVWLIGAVLAYQHRRGHPTSARLFIAGLAVFFLTSLIFTPLPILLPQWLLVQSNTSAADIGWIFFVINCVSQLFSAFGWALVIAALYLAQRELAAQTGPDTR